MILPEAVRTHSLAAHCYSPLLSLPSSYGVILIRIEVWQHAYCSQLPLYVLSLQLPYLFWPGFCVCFKPIPALRPLCDRPLPWPNSAQNLCSVVITLVPSPKPPLLLDSFGALLFAAALCVFLLRPAASTWGVALPWAW